MADLTEFLVSLGYTAKDANSWIESAARIEKAAAKVTKALAAAASAVVAIVAKSSASFEGLAYAAGRTNTSVENLKAVTFAFRQAGMSGNDASASIEAFAAEMRLRPGTEGLIRNLGVATREGGKVRDYVDILFDAVDALNKEPNYIRAAHTAGQLGVSEPTYAMWRANAVRLRGIRDEYRTLAKSMGVDQGAGGAGGIALQQQSRQAMMQIGLMLDVVVGSLSAVLIPLIDRLNAWMVAHKDEIVRGADAIVDFVSSLIEWFGSAVAALAPLAENFDDFIRASTGENGFLIAAEALSLAWVASVALRFLGVGWKVRAGIVALTAAFVVGKYAAQGAPLPAIGEAAVSSSGGGVGLIGNAWNSFKQATGFGDGGVARNKNVGTAESGPMLDRSSFDEELKNPEVAKRLFAMTEAEVGPQGEDAQKAFMETIFNRAKARRQTLEQTLSGSYFPAVTHGRAGRLHGNPRLDEKYQRIFDDVRRGSNITNGATGNASGSVGFDGGPLMKRFNGEGFGVEKQDMKWWMQEQERLQRENTSPPPKVAPPTPWGNPADTMTVPPLSSFDDGLSVTATRTTRIVVKGDTDPHRTAQDVTDAQRRVNMDLITSTSRATA